MLAGASRTAAVEVHVATAPIHDEWDELADRAGAAPFLRPGWFDAWLAAFGSGALHVLAARRGGRLVGVVPVLTRRAATLSPTNFHTPVFDLLAEDDAAAQALIRGLLARRTPRIDLSFLPLSATDSAAWQPLFAACGHRVIVRPVQRSPYITLDGGWDEYRAGLRRGFRRELARCGRRLSERGEVSFECHDGTTRLADLLADGFAIEASGWKASAGTAILSRPETRRFYEQVARWAADRGWLRLGFLRVDGRPIAFDFALEAGPDFHVLKGGFLPQCRGFAPGMLLTARLLERAFERGLRSYELLGNADEYKLRWTDRVRPRIRVQAFPASPAGRVSFLGWHRGRPLVKAVVGATRKARADSGPRA